MSARERAGEEGAGEAIRGLVERLALASPLDRVATLRHLPEPVRRALYDHWPAWAHPGQAPGHDDWPLWLIRAGRGFGKTRAGAEWVQAYARAHVTARIALVGGTAADVAQVMVEGASGLIATTRHGERWTWRRDMGEFTFASGARAFVYSAEAPERLRGPEHDAAWCDELAKWRYGEATWDNLMLGLRLGARPQVVVTTTPRPTPLMRRVMGVPGAVETRGGTQDNPHLPAAFRAQMEALYGGTRLGRQELAGELVDDLANALWTRALLDRQRVAAAPGGWARVVVGVDPPAGMEGDACGIVAVARGADGCGYVLEDASVVGASPEGWARAVAACARRHGADRVVAEKNQGGEMVGSVLRAADAAMPFRLVHAVKAKGARAEPVATLYELGRMWHVGMFASLEDELCGLTPLGYEGPGRSPDRADALVWAAGFLMLDDRVAEAGVRVLR
jgi:phage terminase large subunit-like protein